MKLIYTKCLAFDCLVQNQRRGMKRHCLLLTLLIAQFVCVDIPGFCMVFPLPDYPISQGHACLDLPHASSCAAAVANSFASTAQSQLFEPKVPSTASSASCTISAEITPSLPQFAVLCPGETLTLTATGYAGTAPYSYSWSSGQASQSITIPNPGIFGASYSVTITDANGCTGIDFIHLKYLEWTANLSIEPGFFCQGESATLTAEIFPIYAGSTFAWSTGATTQTINITGNGTYSVTITNPEMPCTSVFNSIVVDAFFSVPAPFPQISGTASLCPGQNGSLVANGGPFTTYVWTPTYASETETLPITDPGIYTVYVTNAVGCDGEDSFEVLGGGMSPELNAPDPICPGQSTTLEVTNAAEFQTFLWSNGESSPSITVTTPDTYSVTVTATGGCTATGSVTVTSTNSNINISGTTTRSEEHTSELQSH